MMKLTLSALLAGLLFGAGLTISGMVDPVRVLGFLDITGDWDPTLAFVMAGGLCVYIPIYYLLVKPRNLSLLGEGIQIPINTKLDKKLLIGSSIFGIGWGMSGICPGPAISSISGGQVGIVYFVITMLVGMMISTKVMKSLKN
jgi:uncharacterized membrane protein YedE/YeeE